MFHSSDSSKFLNFSFVMMSAAGLTRFSVPSTTCHPDGSESIFHPRHPAVVFPSNSRRQPAARSSGVSVLTGAALDRKSTRLNSSHSQISYAVFCLKKKKTQSYRKAHMLVRP